MKNVKSTSFNIKMKYYSGLIYGCFIRPSLETIIKVKTLIKWLSVYTERLKKPDSFCKYSCIK